MDYKKYLEVDTFGLDNWQGEKQLREREREGMDATKIAELKLFVEQCKSNPTILYNPSLGFFKSFLER